MGSCCSKCDDNKKDEKNTNNSKELTSISEPLVNSDDGSSSPALPISSYDINNTKPISNNNSLASGGGGSAKHLSANYLGSGSNNQDTSPYLKRHGSVSRNKTVGDYHSAALQVASPKTFRRLQSSFRVFIATWNVGDAEPASMQPLFAHINDNGRGADIIFIGSQECEYKPSDVNQSARDHWNACIDAIFPDYKVVANRGLWSMKTVALVKSDVANDVKDIVISREATGIGGVGGNKGGIAVGMTVFETRLLFVSSHLAAHLEEVEKRNSDYYEIVEGIEKDFNQDGIEPLNYFHHVFWLGDLNFRIDLSREEVLQAVKDKDLSKLHHHDQLLNEMKKNTVFNGFVEAGTPTFTPTYRFLRNTDPSKEREYDDFKGRIPSWCDRILYKSLGASVDQCHVVKYDAEHAVRSSDHSPVYAIFDVNSREKTRLGLEMKEAEKYQSVINKTKSNNNQNKNDDSDDSDDFAAEDSFVPDHHLLTISKVSATDLLDADMGTAIVSDPYIIFRVVGISDAIDASPQFVAKTPVIANNLNPNWEGQVFRLDLGTSIAVGMLYLHAILFDEDMTVDDPLGQAVFPLEQAWNEKEGSQNQPQGSTNSRPVSAEMPVMHNGKQYGSLKLTMEITKA